MSVIDREFSSVWIESVVSCKEETTNWVEGLFGGAGRGGVDVEEGKWLLGWNSPGLASGFARIGLSPHENGELKELGLGIVNPFWVFWRAEKIHRCKCFRS